MHGFEIVEHLHTMNYKATQALQYFVRHNFNDSLFIDNILYRRLPCRNVDRHRPRGAAPDMTHHKYTKVNTRRKTTPINKQLRYIIDEWLSWCEVGA